MAEISISEESARREQKRLLEALAGPTGQEVAALLERFASEAAEKAAEETRLKRELRQERRLEIREDLRNGIAPDHFKHCAVCMRAILTLAGPGAACATGRQYQKMWPYSD